MERSKSQILYNFLQDDTFDHAETGIIGRVTDVRRQRQDKPFPDTYFIQRIGAQLGEWTNDVEFNFGNTQIIEPRAVEFEVFPRTFECPSCGYLTQFNRSEMQSARNGTLRCEHDTCSHRFTARDQVQLVQVCKCGRIESLYVPDNGIYKLNRSSRGLASSTLEGPGDESRRLGRNMGECYECGRSSREQRVKVHSASSCFYPQRATFVNADREEIKRIQNNTRYQENVLVDYLSADTESQPASANEALNDKIKQALDKIGQDIDEVEAAVDDVEKEREQQREEVREFVEDAIPPDQQAQLSEEIFEYQALDEDSEKAEVYSHTLQDLMERASRRTPQFSTGESATVYSEDKLEEFLQTRNELGVSEVRLLENFPVTTTIYGYSRLNYEPTNGTHLRKFYGEHGTEIYALTAEAEAVQFTLDPATVYEWLMSLSFIEVDETVDTDDVYELRRWFLEELTPPGDSPIPRFDDITRENEVRHAVLTLLHSYSHVIINSIDALSGYSRESLVEYLLPRPLSFVIYKRSDTDYSLGSIFTLIEDRFTDLAEQIRSEEAECLYDPVCQNEDGHACEGCLYVSNLSCQFSNHSLSRAPLYGGSYHDAGFDSYLETARDLVLN
ncbi:hypothetical protein [Natrinema sp. CGMCC1.2065]|uniref:hypothetical protein n=1 Tax=Natrinema sp. CGMCC1.2065 TaxID=3445767 RepID=UPI003F49D4C1